MVVVEILTLVPDGVEIDMVADCYETAEVGDSETARADGFAKKVVGFGAAAGPVEVEVELPALPELAAESDLAHSRR